MSVALSNPAPGIAPGVQPPPAGVQWIDVAAAAGRMGVSVRRVRQLCGQEWMAAGTARFQDGAWEVREDAHPGVARIKWPEQIDFDMGGLTGQQRRELLSRKRIVDLWQAARAAGVKAGRSEEAITAAFLTQLEADEGVELSRRTLFAWQAGWRRDGYAGLVDGRWLVRADKQADAFMEEVKRLYLLPGKCLSLAVCHTMTRLAAETHGWPLRSYQACRRVIAAIPEGVKTKFRQGNEAFANRAEPHVERDYSTLQSNEVWQSDHHECDLWVLYAGRLWRPWLTPWMDSRSRFIVGRSIYVHDPNSDTIIESFGRAVARHGVPEQVYIDNGRDFTCQALGSNPRKARRLHVEHDTKRIAGLFGGLGVGATHALPYNAKAKTIERFFRTMEERFVRLFDTWCGNSPATRPEELQAKLKAGQAPTLEEFIRAFDEWLDSDYHHRVHSGDGLDGQTPAAVYAANLVSVRRAPDAALKVLTLRPSRPVKVTRNGVLFDGLHYNADALWPLLDKYVVLRADDQDRSAVLVFDREDRFLCKAEQVRKLPFRATSQAIRQAMREKGRVRRKAREFIQDVRPRMTDDLPDLLIRGAAEQARAAGHANPPPPQPAAIRPIHSPINDQLPAIQRAMEAASLRGLRAAAGAESMCLDLAEAGAILRSQQQSADVLPAVPEDVFLKLTERLRSEPT